MLIALGAGLALGLLHVLSGPDHLGAIAPIATIERQRVWAIGLRWGLGHTLGIIIIAVIAAGVAHWAFVDAVSASGERLVGVMLIAIAAWGFLRLRRLRRLSRLAPPPAHNEIDSPQPDSAHRHPRQRYAPYAIGVLHGCAGGSHVVAILLALAFPTVAGVMMYLAGFVAGSVLAMTAFAAGIGSLTAMKGLSPRFQYGLMVASSCFSALIGTYWLFA